MGAGGARGLAHAGLLRALSRAGKPPACVAGTSIGALVGAVFCGGDLDGFCRYIGNLSRLDAIKLADPVFPRSGLFEGQRFMRRLKRFLTVERLEDCARNTRRLSIAGARLGLAASPDAMLGGYLPAVHDAIRRNADRRDRRSLLEQLRVVEIMFGSDAAAQLYGELRGAPVTM